ncbi:hypothetical protein D2A34_26085 [Clostridium chromiireducens]|uniref:Uncharacterized protein n=1 Tax=Clostridium chromiireducens TaxID=225345 RepID=A0A399IG75_9CLOT|nr:hypothetical protein [Clostridium chromiireducens]RII31838.1 hypothetical protein D2A34_26085 [Clostridium chromiireducens]
MNESIKNNTFLKSILVLVIGAFIFDLFFKFITGSGNYYSFKGLINELLVLLIKILVVLFLIIVIAMLTKWLKEIYKDNIINTEVLNKISNTPALKLSLMIAVLLIGVTFIFEILNIITITSNNMNMGVMTVGYNNGTNLGLNIVSLMAFLVKLLIGILFIALTFGCFMYLKEQYEKGTINSKTSSNSNNIKSHISVNNDKRTQNP